MYFSITEQESWPPSGDLAALTGGSTGEGDEGNRHASTTVHSEALGGDAKQSDSAGHEDGRGPATLVHCLVQEQLGGNRVGHEC